MPSRRPTERNLPPSLADIEDLARAAYAAIPERLARHVSAVVIRVDDFPDEETMDEMGLESAFDLLGLYRGVPLDHKSVASISNDLDMIFLYRRPILDYWAETGEPLDAIVRHVLIHEVGHHFGLSDAEMAAIEEEASEEGRDP